MNKSDWPHFKRLLEMCSAEADFAKKFIEHPAETLADTGLAVHEETALEAVNILFGTAQETGEQNLYLKILRETLGGIHHRLNERMKPEQSAEPAFLNWYTRQRRKLSFESRVNRKIAGQIYVPVSFELTKGCSMHCPFCCFAADKLTGCFQYTKENALLWKEILIKSKEIFGELSENGICYFATEPLDNPAYELFLQDYYDVYGHYPQTTTARAANEPERMKALLNTLGEEQLKNAEIRFSVYSLEQLRRIHSLFSPEELVHVELILNNPESRNMYSCAGRARNMKEKLPEGKVSVTGSSVCTAGFVVNMVEQSIMLVAPRRADEQHPMGMKVYDRTTFTDSSSYEKAIEDLIQKWMSEEIPMTQTLHTGPYIQYQIDGDYVRIQGDCIHRTIQMSADCRRCFQLIIEDGKSVNEALQIMQVSAAQEMPILEKMNILYQAGYLESV